MTEILEHCPKYLSEQINNYHFLANFKHRLYYSKHNLLNNCGENLIITTGGCGGGMTGPNGVYAELKNAFYFSKVDVDVLLLDTAPDDIDINVNRIISAVNFYRSIYKHIFLMGWSMGGATVINAAFALNGCVSGLFLISTQGADTQRINKLSIPICFVHGDCDDVLSHRISERMYRSYDHTKELHIVPRANHNYVSIPRSNFSFFIKNVFCKLFYVCDLDTMYRIGAYQYH